MRPGPAVGDRRRRHRRCALVASRFVLEVRLDMPAWKQALAVGCSILLGMLISALILIVAGVPPGELIREFASNVFDRQSFRAVLVQAAPLILVGIAAATGFRARFWNLGLEGQMVWGGIAVTAVSVYQIGPEPLRLPLMALFAMLAGMAWVAIPALLRMKFAVNEIISTLLLNYVATYFLYDLLYGAWKDPTDAYPHSAQYAAAERLPEHGLRGECRVAAGACVRADGLVARRIQPLRLLSEVHLRQPSDGTTGRACRRWE